jgi:hypothetical protein
MELDSNSIVNRVLMRGNELSGGTGNNSTTVQQVRHFF